MNTHVHSKQAFPQAGSLALSQELSAFLEPEASELWIKCFNISPLCSKIDILKMERSNCTNFSPLTQSGDVKWCSTDEEIRSTEPPVPVELYIDHQTIEKRQIYHLSCKLATSVPVNDFDIGVMAESLHPG